MEERQDFKEYPLLCTSLYNPNMGIYAPVQSPNLNPGHYGTWICAFTCTKGQTDTSEDSPLDKGFNTVMLVMARFRENLYTVHFSPSDARVNSV